MTQLELARKVLSEMEGQTFVHEVSSYEGGACGDGWCDTVENTYSAKVLRGMIKEQIDNDELFKGLEIEAFEGVPAEDEESVEDMAWPGGGPEATVKDVIPDELSDLSNDLESLDVNNEDEVSEMRKRLMEVKGGSYTFYFDVTDGEGDYYFAENESVVIELTSDEALGLLRGEHDIAEVFDGICDNQFDESLINDKAVKIGVADGYDNHTYSSDYDEEEENELLDSCVDAWVTVIQKILDGEITEDDVDDWLWYFDDTDNFEEDIESWHDEMEEFEDEDD